MNYNEMTAAQCADWLAEKDGVKRGPQRHDSIVGDCWYRINPETGRKEFCYHPYQMTLDSAESALREPWDWDEVQWYTAHIEAVVRNIDTGRKLGTTAPDELTARYRAAVAARMEEDK